MEKARDTRFVVCRFVCDGHCGRLSAIRRSADPPIGPSERLAAGFRLCQLSEPRPTLGDPLSGPVILSNMRAAHPFTTVQRIRVRSRAEPRVSVGSIGMAANGATCSFATGSAKVCNPYTQQSFDVPGTDRRLCEKGPASLHLAADKPRTVEMHTDLVHSAGECQ